MGYGVHYVYLLYTLKKCIHISFDCKWLYDLCNPDVICLYCKGYCEELYSLLLMMVGRAGWLCEPARWNQPSSPRPLQKHDLNTRWPTPPPPPPSLPPPTKFAPSLAVAALPAAAVWEGWSWWWAASPPSSSTCPDKADAEAEGRAESSPPWKMQTSYFTRQEYEVGNKELKEHEPWTL